MVCVGEGEFGMPLSRITIEEVGSSAPVDKRWLCEMEVGNAGTFRTVHVQKASLAEILKEIDRQYTGKTTMELLAELPKKRKPGRQPGWRKQVVPKAEVPAALDEAYQSLRDDFV